MRASSRFTEQQRLSGPLLLIAMALAVVGAGFILISGWSHAPSPPVHEAGSLPPPTAAGARARGAPVAATIPAVRPVALDIPAIGVSTKLLELGLNADHTLQVPPHDHADQAGWYVGSVPSGDVGSSVIAGHVDSDEGPAVFYELGTLKPGDTVRVTRNDRRTAVFKVDRIASFAKDRFPTRLVYGNVSYAGLRLITCGGDYDKSEGGYQSNTVVFASLVRMR